MLRVKPLGIRWLVYIVISSILIPANLAMSKIQFDQNQLNAITKIQTYLNSITTMEGDFLQIGPYGGKSNGKFYIQRPGKIRFNYNPPANLYITSDGSSVAVVDTKIRNQDIWPLGQTPLRYLISDSINVLEDANVLQVEFNENLAILVIEESAVIGKSKLAIFFDLSTMELRQWTITDPQGLDTLVSIFNLKKGEPIDPEKFVINYAFNRFERSTK